MKYRRLGSPDLPVSVIGIGTWQFGGEWGRDYTVAEVRAILDSARELGINLLDTAECYGDHVDLYQFHSDQREAFDDQELWEALAEQVKVGRIRHLGISIGKNDDATTSLPCDRPPRSPTARPWALR